MSSDKRECGRWSDRPGAGEHSGDDDLPFFPLTLARPESVLLAGGTAIAALGLLALSLAPQLPGPLPVRQLGQFLLLGGGVLALAGLGLIVFAPVRAGQAAAAVGLGSHRVMLTTTVFTTLLAAGVGTLLPVLMLSMTGRRDLHNVPGFLVAAISVASVLLGVAYFRFIRPGVVRWSDFGFGRNRAAASFFGQVWIADLVMGVGGYLLIAVLSVAMQAALRALGVEQTQLRDYTWVRELSFAQLLGVLLAGAVLAPLAEEIFFRGIIFGAYLRAKGPLVAYLASAGVFALLHLNLPALAPILLLGLVLAWLYRATGSLVPGVLAHGLNNGVAFVVLYSGLAEGARGG